MTCRRRVWEVAEQGACPSSSSPEVLEGTENADGPGPRSGFKSWLWYLLAVDLGQLTSPL